MNTHSRTRIIEGRIIVFLQIWSASRSNLHNPDHEKMWFLFNTPRLKAEGKIERDQTEERQKETQRDKESVISRERNKERRERRRERRRK